MNPLDFETTISVNGYDVNVVLTGNYIPKTICNSSGGFHEYEGNCIDDMKVIFSYGNGFAMELTHFLPDEVLEKLERDFVKYITRGIK